MKIKIIFHHVQEKKKEEKEENHLILLWGCPSLKDLGISPSIGTIVQHRKSQPVTASMSLGHLNQEQNPIENLCSKIKRRMPKR